MGMTVTEIARAVGGALEGDGAAVVHALAGLQEAAPGTLSFLSSPRYAELMEGTRASAVIVGPDWKGACRCALIRVQNADKAFAAAASLLGPKPVEIPAGIHPTAVIADDVRLGEGVRIGPHCVLEPGVGVGARTILMAGCYLGHGTTVGEDCRLYPHVSVRESTRIGNRTVIHNGAVIGSDGFGYVMHAGAWQKVPQIGTVEIGDDVEIGANVTVDRARFGKTLIGNDVKIDNLVQIAHNVRIGDHTAMAAQTAIAGSSTVGCYVQIGGQAGIAGHLSVGDQCVVGGGAGVTKSVPPQTFVSGYPAAPHDEARKIHAHLMRLPELKKRVTLLEQRIRDLEGPGGAHHGGKT